MSIIIVSNKHIAKSGICRSHTADDKTLRACFARKSEALI